MNADGSNAKRRVLWPGLGALPAAIAFLPRGTGGRAVLAARRFNPAERSVRPAA